MRNKIKSLCLFVVLVISLLSLTVSLSSCGNNTNAEKGSESNPVKIGVVGASDPQWEAFKEAAKKEGIFVDILNFSEYSEPNPALDQKQLDMNEFQHILFLAEYNKKANSNLTPIAATAVYPIGIYGDASKDVKSIKDLNKGDKVAIPNDGTNQSRAIFTLESNGLINFKEGVKNSKTIVTPADIDDANSEVTVQPVLAAETSRSLTDPQIKAAVVNNDFVKYLSDDNQNNVLAREKSDSEGAKPYINIFATRNEDKDNQTYLKLAQIFNTDPQTQAALIESAGGENLLNTQVNTSQPAYLEQILESLEEKV